MKRTIQNRGVFGVVLCMLLLASCDQKKVAYVNTMELYEKFDLQKAKAQELNQWHKTLQSELDSVAVMIDSKAEQIDLSSNEAQSVLQQLGALKRKVAVDREELDSKAQEKIVEYSDAIWKQINQYVQDYAKTAQYDLIMGANGMGSVMYADSSLNITNDLVEYCNARYNGSPK